MQKIEVVFMRQRGLNNSEVLDKAELEGKRKIAARRGDPHPRAVKVIACGAARRRRPAAIPSGRGRLRGYAQTPAAPPAHALTRGTPAAARGRDFPSRTLPIQGRHGTPPLPPLMPKSGTDAAPLHTTR